MPLKGKESREAFVHNSTTAAEWLWQLRRHIAGGRWGGIMKSLKAAYARAAACTGHRPVIMYTWSRFPSMRVVSGQRQDWVVESENIDAGFRNDINKFDAQCMVEEPWSTVLLASTAVF